MDKYAPDILWYDSWLHKLPESYLQKMVAHHFNTAISRGQSPMVIHKQNDLPEDVSLLDIEQGGKTDISETYWMTDITISYSSWCYTEGQTYKDPALVIRNMIDVWSKNGVVLLNVSPTAEGVINDTQREILKKIGEWISKHKEAIYETRGYDLYGYGDAGFEKGHFGGQAATIKYSSSDYRFARSKGMKSLFVYVLGLPQEKSEVKIKHIIDHAENGEIKSVSVVGSGVSVHWTVDNEQLVLITPQSSHMDEIATVFKIDFQ